MFTKLLSAVKIVLSSTWPEQKFNSDYSAVKIWSFMNAWVMKQNHIYFFNIPKKMAIWVTMIIVEMD